MAESNKQIKIWYLPIAVMLIFAVIWFLLCFLPVSVEIVKTIENANIKDFFVKYNGYFGLVAGALSMIAAYVLLILARFIKILQVRYLQMAIILASVVPWLALSLQLIYREDKYTDLAKAFIVYSSRPMLGASLVVLLAAGLFFAKDYLLLRIKTWKVKNLALILIFTSAPFVLTGCVGDLILPACPLVKDSDTCYQSAAIQESRPELCEKIIGKNFLGTSSNPPRDKCYLKIAETTGDLSACDQIKGGLMSYSRNECLMKTARIFADPSACEKFADLEAVKCRMELMIRVTPEKVVEIDEQIRKWRNKLGSAEHLAVLEERREAMIEVMSVERKKEYEKLKEIKVKNRKF